MSTYDPHIHAHVHYVPHVHVHVPTSPRPHVCGQVSSIDVLSLNHYSTHIVRGQTEAELAQGPPTTGYMANAWYTDQQVVDLPRPSEWRQSNSPWEVDYAPGLRALLNWAAGRTSNRWKVRAYRQDPTGHPT